MVAALCTRVGDAGSLLSISSACCTFNAGTTSGDPITAVALAAVALTATVPRPATVPGPAATAPTPLTARLASAARAALAAGWLRLPTGSAGSAGSGCTVSAPTLGAAPSLPLRAATAPAGGLLAALMGRASGATTVSSAVGTGGACCRGAVRISLPAALTSWAHRLGNM